MKKLLTSITVIIATAFSPALRAEALTDTENTSDTEYDGAQVGVAANEGMSAAKKKQWQNIALAVGAVAVAVTALILVASNDGHHASKSPPKN